MFSSLNFSDEEDFFKSNIFNEEYEHYYFPFLTEFQDKDITNSYEPKTESTSILNKISKSVKNPPLINQNIKNLGKKTKKEFKELPYNFTYDSIFRTIRIEVINELIEFINKLIFKVYNGQIGQSRFVKKFLNIEQSKNKNIKENKKFIKKSLKDIFSVDIKKKYTNYNISHNKDLINNLLNEKDEEKKNLFENIFNLTFIDCMEHLCGKKYFKELEGLKSLDEIFQKQNEMFEYIKDLVFNLEERINRKHSRNRKKMTEIIDKI